MSEKAKDLDQKLPEIVLAHDTEVVEKIGQLALMVENDLSPEQKRQEKLKRGIKVVIGGPSQSGKSVTIEALNNNLEQYGTFSLNASPDGEGRWLQQNYQDERVRSWREKGEYSREFVESCRGWIDKWDGPLMLIDIGGKIDDDKARIVDGATHAVILSNNLSKVPEWQSFFENQGLEVIAKLHSHHDGNKDLQIATDSEQLVGSVHRLERGEPAASRETIKQLAGKIQELVENNTVYQEAHKNDTKNLLEICIPEVFDDLPHEKASDGSEHKTILRSAIPVIYEKVRQIGPRPAWLDGRISAWEAVAYASAFADIGSQDIRLRSPDGFVPIVPLAESEKATADWYEAPVDYGEFAGRPVYLLHNTVDRNRPLSPDDLNKITVPKMPEESIVVISTKGPNWLKASMALGYKDKVHSIATFHPAEGSTIAWSSDKDLLGQVIPLKNQ
ncbi:MAG: CRISPR-associated protein Csx3 [Candidatus Nanosyncoccaceae bacterium]|jgi:CRISPR-associated protein Csx3